MVEAGEVEMMNLTTSGTSKDYAIRRLQDRTALQAAIPARDEMIAELREGAPIVMRFGSDETLEMPGGSAVPEFVTACRVSEAGTGS